MHIPAEIVLQIVENVDGCEDVLKAKLCLAGLDSGDVFGSSNQGGHGDDGEPSITASCATQLDPWFSGSWSNISGFALACREWYASYAPLVFSKIYLEEAGVAALYATVQQPNSPIQAYTRAVILRGARPWAAGLPQKIAEVLPKVAIVGCSSDWRYDRDGPAGDWYKGTRNLWTSEIDEDVQVAQKLMHSLGPASPALMLKVLCLNNCQFPSVIDFICVVRSFQALSVLTLEFVTFADPTAGTTKRRETAEVINRSLGSPPSVVILRRPTYDTVLASVALWTVPTNGDSHFQFMAAHMHNGRHWSQFPGIDVSELKFIANGIPMFNDGNLLGTVSIRLEPCCVRPDTCA